MMQFLAHLRWKVRKKNKIHIPSPWHSCELDWLERAMSSMGQEKQGLCSLLRVEMSLEICSCSLWYFLKDEKELIRVEGAAASPNSCLQKERGSDLVLVMGFLLFICSLLGKYPNICVRKCILLTSFLPKLIHSLLRDTRAQWPFIHLEDVLGWVSCF